MCAAREFIECGETAHTSGLFCVRNCRDDRGLSALVGVDTKALIHLLRDGYNAASAELKLESS